MSHLTEASYHQLTRGHGFSLGGLGGGTTPERLTALVSLVKVASDAMRRRDYTTARDWLRQAHKQLKFIESETWRPTHGGLTRREMSRLEAVRNRMEKIAHQLVIGRRVKGLAGLGVGPGKKRRNIIWSQRRMKAAREDPFDALRAAIRPGAKGKSGSETRAEAMRCFAEARAALDRGDRTAAVEWAERTVRATRSHKLMIDLWSRLAAMGLLAPPWGG